MTKIFKTGARGICDLLSALNFVEIKINLPHLIGIKIPISKFYGVSTNDLKNFIIFFHVGSTGVTYTIQMQETLYMAALEYEIDLEDLYTTWEAEENNRNDGSEFFFAYV